MSNIYFCLYSEETDVQNEIVSDEIDSNTDTMMIYNLINFIFDINADRLYANNAYDNNINDLISNINDLNTDLIIDKLLLLRNILENIYDNEYNIIKKIKCYLKILNYSLENINSIIFKFYEKHNLHKYITLETINSVKFENSSHFVFSLITYNLYRIYEDGLNNLTANTLNNTEFDNLMSYELTEDKNDVCTICLEELNVSNKVIELKCSHIYHYNCIEQYLKKYNCVCPVCKISL